MDNDCDSNLLLPPFLDCRTMHEAVVNLVEARLNKAKSLQE